MTGVGCQLFSLIYSALRRALLFREQLALHPLLLRTPSVLFYLHMRKVVIIRIRLLCTCASYEPAEALYLASIPEYKVTTTDLSKSQLRVHQVLQSHSHSNRALILHGFSCHHHFSPGCRPRRLRRHGEREQQQGNSVRHCLSHRHPFDILYSYQSLKGERETISLHHNRDTNVLSRFSFFTTHICFPFAFPWAIVLSICYVIETVKLLVIHIFAHHTIICIYRFAYTFVHRTAQFIIILLYKPERDVMD